ncbi:MAG: hypothetical protein F6K34_05555 [Okeania sp. SIO4D6]|nr:hypothetical protein [Okeania sp. SIO4D6]NEP95391.1 hypothetical protein [Okeania sp. SIO2F5]
MRLFEEGRRQKAEGRRQKEKWLMDSLQHATLPPITRTNFKQHSWALHKMRDDFNSFVEWASCPFLIFSSTGFQL